MVLGGLLRCNYSARDAKRANPTTVYGPSSGLFRLIIALLHGDMRVKVRQVL
jgi:hypothetical protein